MHHRNIMKILILLASVALTWGLVAAFGWVSLAVCFALALGSLVFSSDPVEEETEGPARHRKEGYFDPSSATQGGL